MSINKSCPRAWHDDTLHLITMCHVLVLHVWGSELCMQQRCLITWRATLYRGSSVLVNVTTNNDLDVRQKTLAFLALLRTPVPKRARFRREKPILLLRVDGPFRDRLRVRVRYACAAILFPGGGTLRLIGCGLTGHASAG